MKRVLVMLLITAAVKYSFAQSYREIYNNSFKRGEKLFYNVYFKSFLTGRMLAGEITVEVTDRNRKFNGRDTYHIECIGKSVRTFNWFMKIEDRFESFIDEKALFPWYFIRRTHEGHYRKDDEVRFVRDKNMAVSRKTSTKTPPLVQDILSAFYYSRTKDIKKLSPGEIFSLPIFFDDSVFISDVICHSRGIAKTRLGSFNCVLFRPMVLTGNVFSKRYPMTVWISDDENKIPIFARSALILGKVEIELVQSSGLAHPFLSKIE